jgi:aspartate carbamoyltransferase catalytic subunit
MSRDGRMQHILEAQQFDKKLIAEVFREAERMEAVVAAGGSGDLRGKILGALFYTVSTRTRLSFEAAMLRLGGQVISTENPQVFSDTSLGGSLEDTVRMINSYADLLVLRHPEEGAAQRAAVVSAIPVINAGDGGGQHPTQALLDLYTISRAHDGVDGASVVLMGDLANSRTVRSLCYFLGKYSGIRLWLVSPPSRAIRRDIIEYLERHRVRFAEIHGPGPELTAALGQAHVVYETDLPPPGPEGTNGEPPREAFSINADVVSRMRERAIIMHPFPRDTAIARDVDGDRRAFYFRQIQNGLYVRMALLRMLLEP